VNLQDVFLFQFGKLLSFLHLSISLCLPILVINRNIVVLDNHMLFHVSLTIVYIDSLAFNLFVTSEIALNKGEARLPAFHRLPGQKNISRTFQALSPEYEEPCSLRLNRDGEENLL